MKKTILFVLAGACLTVLPLAASAQAGVEPGAGQPSELPARPERPERAVWSDPEFAEIAGALLGSWKTTGPVPEFGNPEQRAEVVMSFAPARLRDLPDTLFVETARADALPTPYRIAFLQFYRRQGAIRMRTLEIRGPGNPVIGLLTGMWAVPEYLPDVPAADLIATLDLEFVRSGDGWVGRTPYPYPTAVGGAVEMTSGVRILPDRIETADRGYAADGRVLWGPEEGDAYSFERIDPPFAVERGDDGLIIITLREDDTHPASSGVDRITFEYSGWLTSGRMFNSSRRSARGPMQYRLPGQLVPGWQRATDGMSAGDWRKFVVPPELAYGATGGQSGNIPPNATLIFEAECINVLYVDVPLPESGHLAPATPGG